MPDRVRLLLVDDDPGDCLAIRRALDESGLRAELVEVTSADHARTAIARGATFDCYLIDDQLAPAAGREDGITLLRQLRASGDGTAAVLLTTRHDEEQMQTAVDAGVTDFFLKGDLAPIRLALRVRGAIRVGRAEARSSELLATATQAARTRDDILAVVSHDLRGPLHAITLAVDALRDTVNAEDQRYLASIERASVRAERLIADLLEASAIENGALALALFAVDAASIVRQAAADHELLAKEAGGEIIANVPPTTTLVSADRERILQVLGNLIGNALKHARGTTITVELARGDTEATFIVRDGGPGITPEELPHVFDRYWSGRVKRGGAGLGLAISKGIIDAHGGRITVDSIEGRGTAFVFTLPLSARSFAEA